MERAPISATTHSLSKMLVALDGSEIADRALSYALLLARNRHIELLLCHAIDRAGTLGQCSGMAGIVDFAAVIEELDAAANGTLKRAGRRAADAGVTASATILDGRTAQALVAFAHERDVDAIVIGSQGKRGLDRFFLGSTAEGVLRRSDVPVFVVPSNANAAQADIERILVAVDDSDPSDAAAAVALDFAMAGTARLTFCGVAETFDLLNKAATYMYDPTEMLADLRTTAAGFVAAQAERARQAGIECEEVVADGEPAEQILRVATAQRSGLIVVGTHGRRGLQRFFLGSVAEKVVRGSEVPVIVVRAASDRPNGRAQTPHLMQLVR